MRVGVHVSLEGWSLEWMLEQPQNPSQFVATAFLEKMDRVLDLLQEAVPEGYRPDWTTLRVRVDPTTEGLGPHLVADLDATKPEVAP